MKMAMAMMMATKSDGDDDDGDDGDLDIAEHPALKVAFLLSCSASHSSNPLTAIIVIVVVIMMVLTFSMMTNHGYYDTCPPGQVGQQTMPMPDEAGEVSDSGGIVSDSIPR